MYSTLLNKGDGDTFINSGLSMFVYTNIKVIEKGIIVNLRKLEIRCQGFKKDNIDKYSRVTMWSNSIKIL